MKYNKSEISLKEDVVEQEDKECLKAIIKGLFLGSGSINNPENKYHLEIVLNQEENLEDSIKILEKLRIRSKKMTTKNKYSIYIKEGEEISKFLALIGANKAVMRFEEIRVKKEMKGKVNRLVNCETANLNKIIDASIKQVNAIKKLKKEKKFENLPENLKELANLRIQNPEASYQELGAMLKEPIGKSGVSHRLEKIVKIAEE